MTVHRLEIPAVEPDEQPTGPPATFARPTTASGTFQHVSCGARHFAVVELHFEALPAGSGVELVDRTAPGTIGEDLMRGIKRGVAETAAYGFEDRPIVDFRATLVNATTHPDAATTIGFAVATGYAFRKAVTEAGLADA